jgi:hypothetical protein
LGLLGFWFGPAWVWFGLVDQLVFMLGDYGLNIGLKRYKTRFEALFHVIAGLYAWGALTLCMSV